MIHQDLLKELLHYEPSTGLFTWKVARGRCKAGSVAGCPDEEGYILLRVGGTLYKAHRLAFLYMTGEWPEHQVDHVNGAQGDNRWSNLRQCTAGENMQNAGVRKSKSGFTGVHPVNGRFRAYITVNGERKNLGTYDTAEQAYAVYVTAKAQHHSFQPSVRSPA